MVEYQCASILINHNQGIVEATVKPNHTKKKPERTMLRTLYLCAVAASIGATSASKLI